MSSTKDINLNRKNVIIGRHVHEITGTIQVRGVKLIWLQMNSFCSYPGILLVKNLNWIFKLN